MIGCGFIAGGYDNEPVPGLVQTHALAFQQSPDVTLVAVADMDAEKAKAFASRWDVPAVYDDVPTMLQAVKPELVSICSPDDTHEHYLRLCLAMPSVKGVWCEKPLSTSPDGCDFLVEQFRQAGKSLLVNFQRNFTEGYIHLKQELDAGRYGAIQKVIVNYTKGVIHNGSHAMDLLVDWFGTPDKMQVFSAQVDYTETDPTVDALLMFDGVPVYMMGFNEGCFSIFEIHLYTETAILSLIDSGQILRLRKVREQSSASGHKELEPEVEIDMGLGMAMLDALNKMVEAIKGESYMISGDRALAGLRITHQLAGLGMKRMACESR